MVERPSTTLDDVTATAKAPTTSGIHAPYAERKLDFQFAMGTGSFGDGSTQTSNISGLRAEVTIEHAQIPDPGPSAVARIYGMTLDQMNALSKAGLFWDTRKNEMVISAGDDIAGMVTVFKGIIQEAYPDFANQPDTPFFVRASAGILIQLKPAAPLSYPAATDASTVLGTLAQNAGLTLEANGISVKLASPYFHGTTWDKIVSVVKASNLYATLDSIGGALAVWSKTGSRSGKVTISPSTGMIGYPQFSEARVLVRTLFGAQVAELMRGPGKTISIESQLKAANGEFETSEIVLNLSSQRPGGPWEMIVTAYKKTYGESGG